MQRNRSVGATMNTKYFQEQRELAKLRIDMDRGTMKGYVKASELKRKNHNGQGRFLPNFSITIPTNDRQDTLGQQNQRDSQ